METIHPVTVFHCRRTRVVGVHIPIVPPRVFVFEHHALVLTVVHVYLLCGLVFGLLQFMSVSVSLSLASYLPVFSGSIISLVAVVFRGSWVSVVIDRFSAIEFIAIRRVVVGFG